MIKHLFVACIFCTTLTAFAQKPYRLTQVDSVPTSTSARAQLDAINDAFLLLGPQSADFWKGRTARQNAEMRESAQQTIRELAVKFYHEHPTDPLRWVGVQQMLANRPEFITGFKPGYDETKGITREFWIVDEAAKAAWEAKFAEYEAALMSAPDVPWEIHERRAFLALSRSVAESARNGPAAIGASEKKIDAFATRFPAGRHALQMYSTLFTAKFRAGGDGAEEIWGRLSASANVNVRERAEAELRKIESQRKPFEMKFTAADGREVDVAQLRGKVVLIDFWATWCGPCIAELPNVKRVYETYREKGFDIVGITLENPRFGANDTPEERTAKLAAAKEKMLKFAAENDMPWPQFYDGTHWKNPYAQQYAVTGIPAMFLLDQAGKVVSTNARGEKLEAEVKRLLKI